MGTGWNTNGVRTETVNDDEKKRKCPPVKDFGRKDQVVTDRSVTKSLNSHGSMRVRLQSFRFPLFRVVHLSLYLDYDLYIHTYERYQL
jgi:hypothetical protein